MEDSGWGWLALLPLALTLVLAFTTRSALVAMAVGAFAGSLMLGAAPGIGFNELLQRSLGNAEFIWICEIVVLIGVLFELFRRADVLSALARRIAVRRGGRRRIELTTWGMGFLIVDDYFSPLLTGAVMRPMSDRAQIPREKLAFLLDATTASVCILVPFTAWGAYLASLIAAQGGPVRSAEQGLAVFIAAIPYNFYPMFLLLFALLIAAGWLPDFGPMRRAERRVRETGQLMRPGARPLVTDDGVDTTPIADREPSILLELAAPVVLLIGFGAWTLVSTGAVKIVEAFLLADTWLLAALWLRGCFDRVEDVAGIVVRGAASVAPALLIVALAYALNTVTAELGAAELLIDRYGDDLAEDRLVVLTFLLAAGMSFATGTSWGTFALMMPLSLPLAFEVSGGMIDSTVYQTVAAVAGGGIFGDHASPVSDTSVLASVGAGSDHMDHVITQLPYALVVASLTVMAYALW